MVASISFILILLFIAVVILYKEEYRLNKCFKCEVERYLNEEIENIKKEYGAGFVNEIINKDNIIKFFNGKFYITYAGMKYIEHETEKTYPIRVEDLVLFPAVNVITAFFAGLVSSIATLIVVRSDNKNIASILFNNFYESFIVIFLSAFAIVMLLSAAILAIKNRKKTKMASLVIVNYLINRYIMRN